MAKKSKTMMDFFRKSSLEFIPEEKEITGIKMFSYPDDYEDEELAGKPIPWIIRELTKEQIKSIQKKCTIRNKGYEKTDEDRAAMMTIVEACVFPDFRDSQWLSEHEFVDPVDLVNKVLVNYGDYVRIGSAVANLSGMNDEDPESLKDDAKNS